MKLHYLVYLVLSSSSLALANSRVERDPVQDLTRSISDDLLGIVKNHPASQEIVYKVLDQIGRITKAYREEKEKNTRLRSELEAIRTPARPPQTEPAVTLPEQAAPSTTLLTTPQAPITTEQPALTRAEEQSPKPAISTPQAPAPVQEALTKQPSVMLTPTPGGTPTLVAIQQGEQAAAPSLPIPADQTPQLSQPAPTTAQITPEQQPAQAQQASALSTQAAPLTPVDNKPLTTTGSENAVPPAVPPAVPELPALAHSTSSPAPLAPPAQQVTQTPRTGSR